LSKKPTVFNYPVHLVPLKIENNARGKIEKNLIEIPYLLYDVETLSDGKKIVINKPGGKRNYGRLSKHDYMVFVFSPDSNELWLISHAEIYQDIVNKLETDKTYGVQVIDALLNVCNGLEPNVILKKFAPNNSIGIPFETILKVYKWIWGQEDVNYPPPLEGRWKSMNELIQLKQEYTKT
jgi:hypothetical protein